MWQILLGPIKSFFFWMAQKLQWSWIDSIKRQIEKRQEKAKQDIIDKENLAKYSEAIKQGKPDAEISKSAEDLLNGIKR